MRPKKLYRTVITIWTEYDPVSEDNEVPGEVDLEELGREAQRGSAFCERCETTECTDTGQFPQSVTEFFDKFGLRCYTKNNMK